MINLDNFCPLWSYYPMTSNFCDGCCELNYCGECELETIKKETYETLERLRIGL
jgi:hypothetical protein